MSKGLEALERVCSKACNDRDELFCLKHLNCKKAEENEAYYPRCTGCPYCSGNENYKTIEKELKALEIIKKYIRVNKPFGSACYIYLNDESEMIPQEEFDLLKEVLL